LRYYRRRVPWLRVKTGYNLCVPKAALLILLALAFLSGSLRAQRAVATVHGGAAGSTPHFNGQQRGVSHRPLPRRGSVPGGFHRRGGLGSYFFPYDEPFGLEQPENEAATSDQPQIVTQRTAEAPVPKGQVIEIPAGANSTTVKPLPPTIFILASGERLESRRFVLTASLLSISIDRQQRAVPLNQLNLEATVAANHERGIDLRIPDDRNEISLGF
jgi:hypothetical protein